jgi:murein DD-endopeptidase MepM/ murein hydrolase activator NlpD
MSQRKRKPQPLFQPSLEPEVTVQHVVIWKPVVTVTLCTALLLVIGCLGWLHMQAQQRIHVLETRLPGQTARTVSAIAGNHLEVIALKRRLTAITLRASDLSKRVDGMLQAQSQLQVSAQSEAEQLQAEMETIPSTWPTVSRKLSSNFGYRKDPLNGRSAFHAGIDISGDVGEPVFAAGSGVVKEAGFERARGNYIIITHRAGLESSYFHLRRVDVSKGYKVKRGEKIGQLGNTGRSTGPHLHFQVVLHDEPVNPLRYLSTLKKYTARLAM